MGDAARGSSPATQAREKNTLYAGSNNPDEVAWYNEDLKETHPVGQRT